MKIMTLRLKARTVAELREQLAQLPDDALWHGWDSGELIVHEGDRFSYREIATIAPKGYCE